MLQHGRGRVALVLGTEVLDQEAEQVRAGAQTLQDAVDEAGVAVVGQPGVRLVRFIRRERVVLFFENQLPDLG